MNQINFRLSAELVLTLLLMGGVPVFIKFTAVNPVTIGIVRLLIASFLMGIVLILKKEKLPVKFRHLKMLALIGFIFSIHWITYFYSIKTATASIGILGASTYGIHLILLGWIFLNNRPRWVDWLAIGLALLGTYIIIPEFRLSNNITLGLLLSITSGLFFALLPILHQKSQHLSNNVRSFGQYIFALPLFLVFAGQFELEFKQADIYSLLYLGIFGTFLAHTFWINVTTNLPTTFTSLIFYVVIPVTMIISFLWLKEPMPYHKILGAILIVTANILGILNKFNRKRISLDLD